MNNKNGISIASLLLFALLNMLLLISCAGNKIYSATGTIENIENGKDGYTVLVKDEDGNYFDAVISRVKLQNDYKVLKTGDKVKLVGDTIHLDNKVRVLVTKIKQ